MDTKISALRTLMADGQWPDAIRFAAKFPRLGHERAAILDAHMALTNPAFCRGVRKDPDALLAAGIAALQARYL